MAQKEPLIERLLSKLFENHDIIKPDGTYLRRWFIATTRWGCIYLHKIMRSDMDQDPHDHPWNFTSIILKGGYREHTYIWWTDQNTRLGVISHDVKPLNVIRHRAEDIHQVKLYGNEDPAWTLVFRGTYRRHWNFIQEDGPVFWRKYLDYWGPDTLDPITEGDIRLSE